MQAEVVFTFTTKNYIKKSKNKIVSLCLDLWSFPSDLETKMFFPYVFKQLSPPLCSLQTTLRKMADYTSSHHWEPQWKQLLSRKLSNSKLRKKSEWSVAKLTLRFHLKPLRHNNTSSLESPESSLLSPGCLHLNKSRASIQALSSKKLPYQLHLELSPFLFSLSLSPSHRRLPVELAWRTFSCETPLLHLSQLLEQDFQPHRPGGPWRFKDMRDKMTQSPPLQNCLDLPPSSTCPRSRLSDRAAPITTAFLLRHVFACEQQCLPLSRLLLASCPALLPFFCPHSCDWLVSHGLSPVTFTQWCFGCSSGKRVSLFVLFCYYPD